LFSSKNQQEEQTIIRKALQARWLPKVLVLSCLVIAVLPMATAKAKSPPTLRWVRGNPGCTFAHSADGNYYYTLTTVDYDVTLRVDSQELSKVHRRIEPFFSVLVNVRYHGRGTLPLDPSKVSLEFVRHHNVVQTSLDPESFSQRTQDDVDQLEFETEREVKKHPEKKEERERFLQTYKKEATDFQDFLSRQTLSSVELTPANAEATGWILFSTRSKWITSWKAPEAFILRLPIDQLVIEFPFALPPDEDDLELRRRPE
jgi:hypothetical protein